MAKRPAKAPKPKRVEVAVSRLEQHHVDAIEDGPLRDAAEGFMAQRTSGQGFGLVAVVEAAPVGLLGVSFGGNGWSLHDIVLGDVVNPQQIEDRLVAAAQELARPLGALTLLDGRAAQF